MCSRAHCIARVNVDRLVLRCLERPFVLTCLEVAQDKSRSTAEDTVLMSSRFSVSIVKIVV